MHNDKQNIGFKLQSIQHSFTATRLTKFACLSPIMKFINKLHIGQRINELFPTAKYNATEFRAPLKANPLTKGLINGIRVYAAKPTFRRAPIKVFRDALKTGQ